MTELESLLAGDAEAATTKLGVFDYAARLIVPALGIIAVIVGEVRGTPTRLQLGLIAVVIVSLALGFVPLLISGARAVEDRMKDRHVARLYLPQLRKLVDRFGDFVNGSRPDTLHYIADSFLCEGHGQKIAKLAMPNITAWSGRWASFSQRLARQKPDFTELHSFLLDFYDMVGSYDNLCVAAVFDRLPADLAAGMTPRAKSNLSSFQQRFERFLSDSEQLLKEISAARSSLSDLPCAFAPVRPLP